MVLPCNGHYNRTPDLGKYDEWWNTWDLARHTILDMKVLDRNVTWLIEHKDTSWYEPKVWRHLAPCSNELWQGLLASEWEKMS